MSNNYNPHDETKRPRLSVPAPSAEDCSRPDGQYFPYGFPVMEASEDIRKQFQNDQNICAEIFL